MPPRSTTAVSTYLMVSRGWRFVIDPLSNVASPFSLLFKSMRRETNTALLGTLPPRLKASPV